MLAKIERRLRQLMAISEMGIIIALIVVTVTFWLLNPALLSGGSVAAILRALAFVGIIAIGQTLLMIVGELDLSVGSVAGFCAVLSGWLMKEAGVPVVPALAVGLLTGAGIGLINGLLAVQAGIPAFI